MADEKMRKEYASLVQNLLQQAKEEQKPQTQAPPKDEDPEEIEELTKMIRERIQQGR